MEGGRQSGLVFGAVFKTVRRLLKPLVCSIRTVFRQIFPLFSTTYTTKHPMYKIRVHETCILGS
jgi:hypothetical protein